MIDLTEFIYRDLTKNWTIVLEWLHEHVGTQKLAKCNIIQGHGWLIEQKIDKVTAIPSFTLYFDDAADAVMFKLALL